jgi:hypothetical protein
VRHKRDDREQQQQMNQSAGYVKHQKAASPQNQQQQSNQKKGPESHHSLLVDQSYRGPAESKVPRNTHRLYDWKERERISKTL